MLVFNNIFFKFEYMYYKLGRNLDTDLTGYPASLKAGYRISRGPDTRYAAVFRNTTFLEKYIFTIFPPLYVVLHSKLVNINVFWPLYKKDI